MPSAPAVMLGHSTMIILNYYYMSLFRNKLFHLHLFKKLEPQRDSKAGNKMSSRFNNKSFIASLISVIAAMMLTFLAPVFKALPADGKGRVALTLAIPLGANIGGIGTPIGTPPNAIVHSTGLVKQNEMLKVGIVIGVIGMVLGYFTLRLI